MPITTRKSRKLGPRDVREILDHVVIMAFVQRRILKKKESLGELRWEVRPVEKANWVSVAKLGVMVSHFTMD